MRFVLGLILLPFALIGAILRFFLRLLFRPRLPDYVELRLEGSLRWRDLGRRRWALGRKKSGPTLDELERTLAAIEKAPSIRGVIVRADKLQAGRARLVALRDALLRLRRAGKEVVLYWKHADNRHFALVPAASRVLLAPGGPVHLIGYAGAVSALREALDRAGLRPTFVRVGRWKSAPERFTERTPTEGQRALVETVLDRAWANLVQDVAARKGGDEAWAQATIDGGPYTSGRALQAGLVDAMVYPDELAAHLGGGERSRARLAGPSVLEKRRLWKLRAPGLRRRRAVAVVPLAGLIKPGKTFRWPGGSQMAGDESIVSALNEARRDRSVAAVIVSIDSRGGAANASELIWRAVRRCAEEKPTVAWVESVAASGGYFVAAGASHLVAAPGALVGSIGVFSGRFDARALFDRLGIQQEVILRGARSGLFEPAHVPNEGDIAVLQAEAETIYREFIDRVATGRSRDPEEIAAHAEGRVFLASEAPAALVDQVGDFRDALAWACSQAGVDPAAVEVRAHEKAGMRPDLSELFSLGRAAAAGMPLLVWADEVAPSSET